jgi:hypothetical protein
VVVSCGQWCLYAGFNQSLSTVGIVYDIGQYSTTPNTALSQAAAAVSMCWPDRKEALWPYIREFADNALTYVCSTMAKLQAAGEACELYDIHGHYADAGEAAALMSYTLGVDMVLTGHSLGRNKLEHLLKSGGQGWQTKQLLALPY